MSSIAFIKIGSNSSTNNSVENLLKRTFPEFEIETYDVTHDFFKSRLTATLFMLKATLREYGRKHGALFSAPWRNTYSTAYFKKVRSLIRKKLNPARFAFTFQMQSLFDAGLPEVPNFVFTDHTHLNNLAYPDFNRNDLASPSWLACEREIYNNAAMIFTMSSNITQSLINDYQCHPSKTACVFAGSNLPAIPPPPINKDYSDQHILFIGVDWQRKGGPDLLAAFQKIRQTHTNARLTIAGCSPKVNLPGVTVLGPCSKAKTAKLYEQATIFCLPTRREPFGIAFIEAMSFGLPVIGTNLGAQPDFIIPESNGIMVAPGDIAGLAAALSRLLSEPQTRRGFGRAGYELATRSYTWEHTGALIREHIITRIS